MGRGSRLRATAHRVRSGAGEARQLISYVWYHPENRERRIHALARLVGWQLWQQVVRRPVTVRLGGLDSGSALRLRVHPHSTSAAGVLYCALPDRADMRFLLDYVRDGDVVVDAGANVGVYTLLAASVSPATGVIAFEPSGLSFRRLEENVALNGLGNRVSARRLALGEEEGVVELTVGGDATNRVLDASEAGSASERVSITTLAEALTAQDWARVSLLKIDVEGLEAEVLRGAGAELGRNRPALIVEPNDAPALRDVLEELGYHAFVYDPATRELQAVGWGPPAQGRNLVVLADLDEAEQRIGTGER